jgi:nicotinamidase-related amidase
MLAYTEELERAGKKTLCVWPEHCIIGSWGHGMQVDLFEAVQRWERKRFGFKDAVAKGVNIYTEHYGALKAEVPDASDRTTELNRDFLTVLQQADIIAFAGEAASHCVLETINQIATFIGDEHLAKCHILTDCMSPVIHPAVDFPAITQQFFDDMVQRGMTLTTSVDFLS